MAASQANVTEVRVSEGGGDPVLSWTSTDPPGTVFQVYVDYRRVWSGVARSMRLAVPVADSGTHRVSVEVVAVGPNESAADFSASLPAPAGGGDRPVLYWYGGTYLDQTIVSYEVYAGLTPGAAVDASAPAAVVTAYPGSYVADGFGLGGFGLGGFGLSATSYSWTSPPRGTGSWNYSVVPVNAAGMRGTPVPFTVAVARAPTAPPADEATGLRVNYTFDGPTATLVMTWSAASP